MLPRHNFPGFLKIYLLNMLKGRPMHGYELMKELELWGWKPSPGSIYPILASLQKKKLISVKTEANRKVYYITKTGKNALKKIEREKQNIKNDMKRAMRVVSNFLGEDTKFPVATKKIDPRLMISMIRIGRKLVLCTQKNISKSKIRKILNAAEKEVDKLLEE